MASIRLRVRWSKPTLAAFDRAGIALPYDEKEAREFGVSEPPFVVQDLAQWLEAVIEGSHFKRTGDRVQVQVHSIRPAASPSNDLPYDDHVDRHFKPGDTIIVDAQAITGDMAPEFTEAEIAHFRSGLRFDLNDRVLCNCGNRWLAGLVVGSAVPDDDGLLPYLVKTDPIPGIATRTISVPRDSDKVCTQEVCFDPSSELKFVKYVAPIIKSKPRLRFAVNDSVVCRIRNDDKDDLENWVHGTVSSVWPELPGETAWEFAGVSGHYATEVPYKVDLCNGSWIYCHKDHHTLIRRKGMEPQTRVRGISRRMEVRTASDGGKERVDHMTERRKRMQVEEDSD